MSVTPSPQLTTFPDEIQEMAQRFLDLRRGSDLTGRLSASTIGTEGSETTERSETTESSENTERTEIGQFGERSAVPDGVYSPEPQDGEWGLIFRPAAQPARRG
ncbi:hypothetical protein [Streptacidiphilus sp. EB103A]|uniref:hypothetical protein n=1 Tax=Streptacidiphilus sp. EB103A TaxID=3156275 RepID=UPI003513B299